MKANDPGATRTPEPAWRPAGPWHLGQRIERPGRPLYMVRWVLARFFGCEVRINVFMSSDPDCLHDHPGAFVSLILCGYYREVTEYVAQHDSVTITTSFNGARSSHSVEAREKGKTYEQRITYRAGRILYRPAKWKHRIEVDGPCMTINFVFRRTRDWGFWSKDGWIPWRKYSEGVHRC